MIHYRLGCLLRWCCALWDTLRGRPVIMAVVARSGAKGGWIQHQSVGLKLAFRRTVYTDLDALLYFNPDLKGKLPL